MVGTALVAGYSYGASTNPVMIDKATMTTTTMTTAANLVRRGDAGQEDFSSTSVGDNSINSVTNSFGEGGGRHRGCVDVEEDKCHQYRDNKPECVGHKGCHWIFDNYDNCSSYTS